jgi:hypothetical protein
MIQVPVPSGAGTGNVVVTVGLGSTSVGYASGEPCADGNRVLHRSGGKCRNSSDGGLCPPIPPGFIAVLFQSGWFFFCGDPRLPHNGGA